MGSRVREEQRKKDYKKGIDPDEARRKRGDMLVEIRRSKRDENMMKKRMYGSMGRSSGAMAVEGMVSASEERIRVEEELKRLPEYMSGVFSNNVDEQYRCTVKIRELLSIAEKPPIDEVVAGGVVPVLVNFLERSSHPKLQFEAAWALTNVASGTSTQTQIVLESGAVPIFVRLLSSSIEEVREQAVWALGNIAGDGPNCRNLVLDHEALEPLLVRLYEATSQTMIRNSTWTLSNLCRGKPPTKFEKVRSALPMLASLIRNEDEEIIADSCWALSYLSDGDSDQIQEVLQCNVAHRLVKLLMHQNTSIQIPALRTIGNIVTGNDEQTQMVIRFGALECLNSLLNSPKKTIRKEACWTISNITAGNKDQIQAVMDNELVPGLIYLMRSAEFDVKKEATWAISNATCGGSVAQIKYLAEYGCIPPMCEMLEAPDVTIINVALDGLEQILRAGEREKVNNINPFANMIEECGGLELINRLQMHDSPHIYKHSISLIMSYFQSNGDEDVEGLAPAAGVDHFEFPTSSAGDGQAGNHIASDSQNEMTH